MSKNVGKVLEAQLLKSVPDYALLYRLQDPAQSFGGSSKLRFSSNNPFDYLMWDSKRHRLYALEAKTVKGKSISFERDKDDKGLIHLHQINGLNEWNKYDGITCGFIIEFRTLEKTIFLDIENMNKVMNAIQKKSFTLVDLEFLKIPYLIVPQKKARTRYTYDLDYLMSSL